MISSKKRNAMRIALVACLVNAAAAASVSTLLGNLSFDAASSPQHTMDISVGVYFEHLFHVNSKAHTFDADFWLVERWKDERDYTSLFYDANGNLRTDIIEIEAADCASGSGSSTGRRLAAEVDHNAIERAQQLRRLAAGGSGGAAAFQERHFVEFGHAPPI